MIRKTGHGYEGGGGIGVALLLFFLAACSHSLDGPTPELDDAGTSTVDPSIVCREQLTTDVAVLGSGFSPVPIDIPDAPRAILPTVTLTRAHDLDGSDVEMPDEVVYIGDPDDAADPTNADLLSWQSQGQLTIIVNQDIERADGAIGWLPEGVWDVEVENATGGASASPSALATVSAPIVTGVDPPRVCVNDTEQAIVIEGEGFLEIEETPPTVEVNERAYEVVALRGCEDLVTPVSVRECTEIDIGAVVAEIGVGTHDIRVTNPEPAACVGTAEAVLLVYPPPTLDGLVTDEICSDTAETIVILGADFIDGATVTVAGIDADSVAVTEGGTRIEATFDAGLPPGTHDVTVETGTGCATTLAAALTVNPSPLVFFVDPPVLYDALALEVTIFTSGLGAMADKVELVAENGDVTEITDFTSPDRPNRIQAPIPAGLDPGIYGLRVTSDIGCVGELDGGITVTDMLTLDVTAVDPAFVSSSTATAITITADPAMGFVSTPRAYLNPVGGGGGATALRAVVFEDDGTLTAVVPDGLAPGEYDLVIVNPTGEVGVLRITVTAAEPPVVTGVVPASFPANQAGTLTLAGSGFDTGGVEIELDCLVGTTRVTVTGTGETVGGSGTSATVDVDLAAGAPSDPTAGSVCIVRVTNGDGAFFEYSALSVTNSSLNLSSWSDASDLVVARRGLALSAGRPTETSRFLYAIGGDAGAGSDEFGRGTLIESVESARVDTFGQMGAWGLQRNDLSNVRLGANTESAPRTQAGVARIGRFLYLVGGHDGAGATATLFRAQILDPLATPQIVDLDAVPGDGSEGLGGGLWLYRVAALFRDDDASNPTGESLPGEVFPVQLPEREEKIILTISWERIPGAGGYRIYRSPAAGDGIDTLERLVDVSGGNTLSMTDDGQATNAGETPLPTGSLGVWHRVSGVERCTDALDCALGTAREGHASFAIEDRGSPGTWYLYAVGGRDAAGTYLASYEIATVTVAADGTQTVADWVLGSNMLSSPRADLAAWVMSAESSAIIRGSGTPDDVWVYLGGGRTTAGAFDRALEAGLVGAGGDLGAFVGTGDLQGDVAGLGAGASNDQLYTFGGEAAPDGTSAQLCDGAPPGACTALPELEAAFNALGNASTTRMFMGSTQESAFFFLAGGHDGASTLATTEQTVQ